MDEHKIPMVLTAIVQRQELFEKVQITVERETEIANPTGFFLLHQPIEHTVIDIPRTETLFAAKPQAVQHIIIEIIRLEIPERTFKHRLGLGERPGVR